MPICYNGNIPIEFGANSQEIASKQEENGMELEEKQKPAKKRGVLAVILVLLIAAIGVFVVYGVPAMQYSSAVKAYDGGDYARAADIFAKLDDYKDAQAYRTQAELGVHYNNANLKAQAGEYAQAIQEYKNAKDFSDSKTRLLESYDLYGDSLLSAGKYDEAVEAYRSAGKTSKVVTAYNKKGEALFLGKQYDEAADAFGAAGNQERQTAVRFAQAESCLFAGYLNKAKALYSALPEDYAQGDVTVADRIKLLNKNQKFLDLVGNWSATDTYYRVQADSTTSSYYYYWYQDAVNLGTVTVTCPYNEDGSFTVQGTATFPSYQNFSSNASEMITDMESFTFSKTCKGSIPYQIDSSSTTKLAYNRSQFDLQYKYVNESANVYWHYTFTSKVKYGNRTMLAEDR